MKRCPICGEPINWDELDFDQCDNCGYPNIIEEPEEDEDGY